MRPTCAAIIVLQLCFTSSAKAQLSLPKWRPLQPLENALLFHPQTAGQRWFEVPPQIHVEDVWLRSEDGQRVHAWWFPCPDSTSAILFCHGNAGNLSQWAPRMMTLQRRLNRSVLIFDYPGYGKSSGRPSEEGCYASADAAYVWLTEQKKIAPEKVVLGGESLGGGVATELALRRHHGALVLVRTFTSIPDMARKSVLTSSAAPLIRNSFDNLARIGKCTTPVFLAHGDRDTLIPLKHAEKLFEAAHEPKQGFLMKECGHNDPYPEELYQALNDFLRRTEVKN